jgi:hypothetical protein
MPYNNLVEQSFFEILEDTRLLLGDVQSVTTSWSDATIYNGINFAVQHYLRITDKSYTEHFDFPISGGVATLPNAYIEVKRVGVEIGGKNRWLLQSSVTDEVNKNPEWLSSTGTPKRWVLFDGEKIRITPTNNATLCSIGYVEEPLNFVYGEDDPETFYVDSRVSITHQRFLKFMAAYWCLQIDGDNQNVQLAIAYLQQFVEFIKDVE